MMSRTSSWRRFTDLTDDEVKALVYAALAVEAPNVRVVERDAGSEEITVEVTTTWSDGEIDDVITDVVELGVSTLEAPFQVDPEERLRYQQWLLAHGVSPLAYDNPFLKDGGVTLG